MALKILEKKLTEVVTVPIEKGSDISRSKHLIRAYVRSRIGFVSYCYHQQLKMNPKLGGRLVINFSISDKGVFQDVVVDEDRSTLRSKAIGDCVAEVFNGLETNLVMIGKGPWLVTYPFSFEP